MAVVELGGSKSLEFWLNMVDPYISPLKLLTCWSLIVSDIRGHSSRNMGYLFIRPQCLVYHKTGGHQILYWTNADPWVNIHMMPSILRTFCLRTRVSSLTIYIDDHPKRANSESRRVEICNINQPMYLNHEIGSWVLQELESGWIEWMIGIYIIHTSRTFLTTHTFSRPRVHSLECTDVRMSASAWLESLRRPQKSCHNWWVSI